MSNYDLDKAATELDDAALRVRVDRLHGMVAAIIVTMQTMAAESVARLDEAQAADEDIGVALAQRDIALWQMAERALRGEGTLDPAFLAGYQYVADAIADRLGEHVVKPSSAGEAGI